MCGIAGIRLLDNGPVDPERLAAMSNALVHRGPDGQGHYLVEGIGLAHRDRHVNDDKRRITGYRPRVKSALLNILGSNAGSQLLIIASTPLLTRRFDREEFGVLGVATTAALLLSTLLSCKLEHSLPTSPRPAALYGTCLTLVFVLGILLALPAAFLLARWLAPADAAMVALFALCHAASTCALLYLNCRARFRAIAAVNLLVPCVFLIGALGLPSPAAVNPLLFWQSLSWVAALALCVALTRRDVALTPLVEALRTLREHRANAYYLVPSHLLAILSLNLAVIGAAWLYDAAIAGLVVIAQRVARAPVSVIGNGLNEVLRAAIPARRAILRTFYIVAAICVATALGMFTLVQLVPERAYAFVLGGGWEGLRPVLAITVFAACFQLVGTSVTSMLTAFAKRSDLVVNVALLGSGLLALALARSFDSGALAYLWTHSLLTAAVYSAAFVLCLRVARRESDSPPSRAMT